MDGRILSFLFLAFDYLSTHSGRWKAKGAGVGHGHKLLLIRYLIQKIQQRPRGEAICTSAAAPTTNTNTNTNTNTRVISSK